MNIRYIRTIRGADYDSDHYLVKNKIKLKLNKIERKMNTLDNYDISKLGNEIISNLFKDVIRNQIGNINPIIMDTVDSRWKVILSTIKSVSELVIGVTRKILVNPGLMKCVR